MRPQTSVYRSLRRLGSTLLRGTLFGLLAACTSEMPRELGDGPVAPPPPPPAVAVVQVTPASASMQVGQTRQLAATARDANGNPLTGRTITWESLSSAIADVSPTGMVSGVAVGNVQVRAISDGITGTSSVTILPIPVASVELSPAAATVQVGATQQLTADPPRCGRRRIDRTRDWLGESRHGNRHGIECRADHRRFPWNRACTCRE